MKVVVVRIRRQILMISSLLPLPFFRLLVMSAIMIATVANAHADTMLIQLMPSSSPRHLKIVSKRNYTTMYVKISTRVMRLYARIFLIFGVIRILFND